MLGSHPFASGIIVDSFQEVCLDFASGLVVIRNVSIGLVIKLPLNCGGFCALQHITFCLILMNRISFHVGSSVVGCDRLISMSVSTVSCLIDSLSLICVLKLTVDLKCFELLCYTAWYFCTENGY